MVLKRSELFRHRLVQLGGAKVCIPRKDSHPPFLVEPSPNLRSLRLQVRNPRVVLIRSPRKAEHLLHRSLSNHRRRLSPRADQCSHTKILNQVVLKKREAYSTVAVVEVATRAIRPLLAFPKTASHRAMFGITQKEGEPMAGNLGAGKSGVSKLNAIHQTNLVEAPL